MSEHPVIELRDVHKAYKLNSVAAAGFKQVVLHLPQFIAQMGRENPFVALDGLTFNVKRGEFFGLIGHNGSGKSTALALIAGVMQPSRGTVRAHGHICPLLELGAGFHPELTGRENVFLNGVLLGMTREQVRRKYNRILEFSELNEFIDQPIRTYSSGMVTRLGFSVAIHLDPEILLIDEVLAVGDEGFQAKCHERLADYRSRGVTTVFVSHDVETVARMSDRVAWLDHGRLAAIGDPHQVVERYHDNQPAFDVVDNDSPGLRDTA